MPLSNAPLAMPRVSLEAFAVHPRNATQCSMPLRRMVGCTSLTGRSGALKLPGHAGEPAQLRIGGLVHPASLTASITYMPIGAGIPRRSTIWQMNRTRHHCQSGIAPGRLLRMYAIALRIHAIRCSSRCLRWGQSGKMRSKRSKNSGPWCGTAMWQSSCVMT